MDHMMPGMDGVEAARIIRQEIGTEYTRNIPIIMLTANAIVGNEEMFLEAGFQAFISKPIDIMKLDSILRRWVRDKGLKKGLGVDRVDRQPPEEAGQQRNSGSGRTEHPLPNRSLLDIVAISGLDIHRGLERFGYDEESYISVLQSYTANTRPLLVSMRENLAAENLKDYAIVVHGVKGSSYGVCAQETGLAAEQLEKAAKEGNLELVKNGHSPFVKATEVFLDKLDAALAGLGAASGGFPPAG
ncbi:MAG: response regulator [Oscillospiraceae bacterium]|nr:response regulator [Oscillospiraceae bacterium]